MVRSFGTCDHGPEYHKSGSCWHILDIKKDGTPVYCKCVHHKGNHKSFAELGYLEPQAEDWLIPKKCSKCSQVFTLHKDARHCASCIDIIDAEEAMKRLNIVA